MKFPIVDLPKEDVFSFIYHYSFDNKDELEKDTEKLLNFYKEKEIDYDEKMLYEKNLKYKDVSKKHIEEYVDFSDCSIEKLGNIFAKIDLLCEKDTVNNVKNIYKQISLFKNEIDNEKYHFELFLSNDGNEAICIKKMEELDKLFTNKKVTYLKESICSRYDINPLNELKNNLSNLISQIYYRKSRRNELYSCEEKNRIIDKFVHVENLSQL